MDLLKTIRFNVKYSYHALSCHEYNRKRKLRKVKKLIFYLCKIAVLVFITNIDMDYSY